MTTIINNGTEMVKLYGGPPVTDGMWIRVPKLAQGIVVYGTLFEPPGEPAPYYPHWYAVEWSMVRDLEIREPPPCRDLDH